MKIPRVMPFRIRRLGWTVKDFRSSPLNEQLLASEEWLKSTSRFLKSQRIDPCDVLCTGLTEKAQNEIDDRFAEAQRTRKTLKVESFVEEEKDRIRKRYHPQPGLPKIILTVQKDNQFVGCIYASNIRVEAEDKAKIQATAMLWVAVKSDSDFSVLDIWRLTLRFLLKNDLRLADGRLLDIVGYDFTQDPTLKDGLVGRPKLVKLIEELKTEFDSTEDSVTGDIRFRRKAVAVTTPTTRLKR